VHLLVFTHILTKFTVQEAKFIHIFSSFNDTDNIITYIVESQDGSIQCIVNSVEVVVA
jgi:hypothetical protein